jgi:hypothetical protein
MLTIMLVAGALAVAAVAATLVQLRRDGYRAVPTRFA